MKTSLYCLLLLGATFLGGCVTPRAMVPASTTTSTQPSTAALSARRAAAPLAAAQLRDPFSGHWVGTWQSQRSGHHGRLLCDFARLDAGHYRADFSASWGVLHGRYSVVFETRRRGDELHFHGEHELGKLFGGLYHYDGRMSARAFTAAYRSAGDAGAFQLHRSET